LIEGNATYDRVIPPDAVPGRRRQKSGQPKGYVMTPLRETSGTNRASHLVRHPQHWVP
jgi:hypothetical protein